MSPHDTSHWAPRLLFIVVILLAQYTNTQVLTPSQIIISHRKPIHATSTRGEIQGQPVAEICCSLTGSSQYTPLNSYSYQEDTQQHSWSHDDPIVRGGHGCGLRNAGNESPHPASNMVHGNNSWWPPLSRGLQHNEINFTIDLEQEFHIAYVWIQVANSTRPRRWSFGRLTGHGKTYKPWFLFAVLPLVEHIPPIFFQILSLYLLFDVFEFFERFLLVLQLLVLLLHRQQLAAPKSTVRKMGTRMGTDFHIASYMPSDSVGHSRAFTRSRSPVARLCRANHFLRFPIKTMWNTLESFELLQLPPELIITVLKNCDFQQCYKVRLTCKYLNNLIKENQKSLTSNDYYYIDLERKRVRAWRNGDLYCWRSHLPQIIPVEYVSKFFCFVNARVLTVNNLDEEMCAFLTEQAKNKKLRFGQLCLFTSLSASHESICQLLKASKCRVIFFKLVKSKLTSVHFEMEQFKNLKSLCFEMDDSIGEEFFDSILNVCNAKKFIFDKCERLPQRFVRDMFEKWLNGSRGFEAVWIITHQNFNFDEVISGLNIRKVDGLHGPLSNRWSMKNVKGEKATITISRRRFSFTLAFKVNDHHVRDILNGFPFYG